jgi:hypothetical protein
MKYSKSLFASRITSINYSLIKRAILLPMLLSMVFLMSCEKDEDFTETIPIDSIYFSCKINDKLVEFEFPSARNNKWAKTVQRLNILKDNSQDSVIIEYLHEFSDDNYTITFCFSNSFLVDTVDIGVFSPNVKEQMYKKGNHSVQYLLPAWGLNAITPMYCGFRIHIYDYQESILYTSNVNSQEYANVIDYKDFIEKSSFEITNSFRLDSPSNFTGSSLIDLADHWILEALFNCKLYVSGDVKRPVYLSEGVLKGRF